MPTELQYNHNRFELLNPTQTEKELQKAGMTLDKRKGVWFSNYAALAEQYRDFANPDCRDRFRRHNQRIMLSYASDCNIDIPSPKGLSYANFQKAAIQYTLPRKDTLNADDMGLGKTIDTLGLINMLPELARILIVSPAFLKHKWAREAKKWLVIPRSISVAEENSISNTDIVVTNYDRVKNQRYDIDQRHWDLLVADEAHYLKTSDSWRTLNTIGGTYEEKRNCFVEVPPIAADRRLFLTGSPLLKRPSDIWPLCMAIDPEGIGKNWTRFATRYCGLWKAPWGWDSTGASHLEELRSGLRGSFMLRRKKKQVMPELKKTRRIVPLDVPELASILEEENRFYQTNKQVIDKAISAAAEAADNETDSFEKAVKGLKKFSKSKDGSLFENLSRLRVKTAEAKLPYILQYADSKLTKHEKIVIYGHHRAVLEQIARYYGDKSVLYYGDMDDRVRDISIEEFQTGDKRVFVGSIGCMLGFELTSACYGLIAEEDWRPMILSQAEDRMDRIGQVNEVVIEHLIINGSLDANIAKNVVEAQEVIDAAID